MKEFKIKISGADFTVKQSYRSLMLFEELTGINLSDMNGSVTHTIKLFYCMVKGCNMNTFNYSFDEFMTILDEEPEMLDSFNAYLISESKPSEKKKMKKV